MLTKGLFIILAGLFSAYAQEQQEQQVIDLDESHFIVPEAVPFAEAENSCVQSGGVLAGLDEAKSAGSWLNLLLQKSGAASGKAAFWMKSHGNDAYAPECIEFSLLAKSAVACNCAELKPVLCEKRADKRKRSHGKKPRREACGACDCPDRFNCDICDYPGDKSSSSSSSTRSDCCTCLDQECMRDYLNDMDFYTNYPIIGQTWSYYQDSNIIANGGVLTTGCRGGFLDSKVYNVTTNGQVADPYSDHFKYFIYANEPIAVPKSGNLIFEYLASSKTFKTEQNGFPEVLLSDAGDDVRMASGVYQVFSGFTEVPNNAAENLVFSFYLTNDRVYVGYERRAIPGFSTYAAFNFLIPVKVRKQCDLHDMKIVFNHANRIVSWRVDGREVFRITKVGYLISRQFMLSDFGGAEGDAFPELLSYGFGSMTLLDNYPACLRSDLCRSCKFPDLREALVQTVISPTYYYNPVLGAPQPAIFWDVAGQLKYRLWGQGSESHLRRLAVYTENCGSH